MRKIWTIAWKELVTTFTDRTLILIMIVTPLLLSTIIALAFGGGDDPDGFNLSKIPIAIVNQDEGLALLESIGAGQISGGPLGQSLLGLGLNPNGGSSDETVAPFNAGATLVSILAPESVLDEGAAGASVLPACTMVVGAETDSNFDTTLDELFAATLLADVGIARQGVETGDFVAAIVIPPGFTQSVLPVNQFGPPGATDGAPNMAAVHVYANAGHPIEANVVRSVVEGVVSQFGRMGIAVLSLGDSVGQSLAAGSPDLANIDLSTIPTMDAPISEWQAFLSAASPLSPWFAALSGTLDQVARENATENGAQGESGWLTGAIGGAIACLFEPNAGAVMLVQQPLNALQEQTRFEQVMVQVGSAQAVFFALFTGAFGILGIYQERKQWTLQRMLVSPTSRSSVLGGFLAGNVVVVWAQLVLLMFFLTVITSIIIRQPTFIWGDQWLLLFLLTVAISLCVSGLGVLIVGVARTPEQVQVFAPVVNIFLGALGGAFGFFLPGALAALSLITWATDAFNQLAAGQTDIWIDLGVLVLQGAIFFGIGLWMFRKRIDI
jgi:ABC-type transport system involved in multi-copper enzyme maturation permease subunit